MAEHPFTQSETTDTEMRVGEKRFHVHSQLLQFYSPVFEKMFQNESDVIKGNRKQSYVINDDEVGGEIMVEFLKFFYAEHSKKIHFDVGKQVKSS